MKILIYCQHVLGVGHLYRTLLIAEALREHEVTLMLGGPSAAPDHSDHIRVIRLPGLKMDPAFSTLLPTEETATLHEVKERRQKEIFAITHDFKPDVLIIELFPFGRNGFSFELLPLLKAIRSRDLPSCQVICSLRDILVEKKKTAKFEQRAVDRLNSLFDALLIHADPTVIRLDETFSRMHEIAVPVVYTGYVAERVDRKQARALRDILELHQGEKLIVVSTGGGNVGYRLLAAAMEAFTHLSFPARMQLFTGPYLAQHDFDRLANKKPTGVSIDRFTENFSSWLGAADLSLSMGGYNTTMNVLATGTPALIFPFLQNREQKMRAEKLSVLACLAVLDANDLAPSLLAKKISGMIHRPKQPVDIRLDGAEFTARWLTQWMMETHRNGK